jgi:hypothetical protein
MMMTEELWHVATLIAMIGKEMQKVTLITNSGAEITWTPEKSFWRTASGHEFILTTDEFYALIKSFAKKNRLAEAKE